MVIWANQLWNTAESVFIEIKQDRENNNPMSCCINKLSGVDTNSGLNKPVTYRRLNNIWIAC